MAGVLDFFFMGKVFFPLEAGVLESIWRAGQPTSKQLDSLLFFWGGYLRTAVLSDHVAYTKIGSATQKSLFGVFM